MKIPKFKTEEEEAQPIHIRLPEADLALARKLAERKGLPYQTYIKSVLHEALQREAKRAS
jgi:predicted DNA binding CopG/RHH family protein